MLVAVLASGCLRHVGASGGVTIGAAASTAYLGEARYAEVLGREFAMLTPENELKWDAVHPTQGSYRFGPTDALVAYADQHGMQVRGHTLVWHQQNPSWLTAGGFTPAELAAILDDHIAVVVGHYADRIVQWDVVNEAFEESGALRSTVWSNGLGPGYIDRAFRAARAADGEAELFYNDFNIERAGPKADAVFAMVSSMRRRGVPIDGVGFQAHLTADFPANELVAQMARYEAIGVDVAITELDVRVPVPASDASRQAQAKVFGDVLAACRRAANCDTLVVWGFTDRHSWVPSVFSGLGAATPLDEEYRPKPAYDAMVAALQRT